jgi:orotate phosphoribosyltransferase
MVTGSSVLTAQEVEDLRALLGAYSMKVAPPHQPFTLASGRTSRLYFDSKPVTLAPEGVLTVGKLFWELARRWGADAVGGLAAGSVPISTAVIAWAAMAGDSDIRSFYVRSEPKEHGTKEQVFQSFHPARAAGLLSPGGSALVVDDVLTTGKSISLAAESVRARGARLAAIAVLVDRREGGAAALRERFNVPVVAVFTASESGELTFHDGEVF